MWVLQRGNSGDGCELVLTLCGYDLRKGNLFVLSCCCCLPSETYGRRGATSIFSYLQNWQFHHRQLES